MPPSSSAGSKSPIAFRPVVLNPNIEKSANRIRAVTSELTVLSARGDAVLLASRLKIVSGPLAMTSQIEMQNILMPAMGISSQPISVIVAGTLFLPHPLSLLTPPLIPYEPVETVLTVDMGVWIGDVALLNSNLSVGSATY